MITECPFCNDYVELDEEGRFSDENNTRCVTLFKCKVCEGPLLFEEEVEYLCYEEDGEEYVVPSSTWSASKRIYPPEEMRVASKAPLRVKSALEKAFACYKAKEHTASVIMCRKTLEVICKECGVNEKNLYDCLVTMKKSDIINETVFKWSVVIKNAGNEAVHGFDMSSEDSINTIDFTTRVIDYIFLYKSQFEEFEKKFGK